MVISKGLRRTPIIGPRLIKKDAEIFFNWVKRSAQRDIKFVVKDNGWARKEVPFNHEQIRKRLLEIDQLMNFKVSNFYQSRHFSRVFELPYAAAQLQGLKGRVLEIGGAATSLQFYLAEQGLEVYSLDPNLNVIRKLSTLTSKINYNIKLAVGNLFNLPFPDDYFDSAACISVLEHALTEPESSAIVLKGGLNEMLRVIKPNGKLILTFDVSFNNKRHLTQNELEKLWDVLGIKGEPLPGDRLYSSDTKEGLEMGEDLAVYAVTVIKQ